MKTNINTVYAIAKHIRWIMDRNTRYTAAVAAAGALREVDPEFNFNEFYVECIAVARKKV